MNNKIKLKRNVIVILCDQLRKDFMPIYGCKAIDTPNIDALAACGLVYDQCITQSTVCAPARATMMTGRYVSDHGVWTNDVPFRKGLDYLPDRMSQLGYHTGAFGKLHHTPGRSVKGFESSRLMEEDRLGNQDDYYRFLKTKASNVESVFNTDETNHCFKLDASLYYEHYIADQAMEFIDGCQDENFFAWVSFQGPHTPYDPPKHWRGKVRKEDLPKPIQSPVEPLSEVAQYRKVLNPVSEDEETIMKIREAYVEMIMEIDSQIGRIVDFLKAKDLMASTTILFSSDHGDLLGDMGLDQKGPYPYESQLGIPLILSNHPDVPLAKRSNLLVGNIDIPSTVLHIAGDQSGIGYSKSLIKMIKSGDKRTTVFSEFCDTIKTVQNEKYRYSFYPFENHRELFDREKDPKMLKNLALLPDYQQEMIELMEGTMEHMLLAKGVQIEAHDLTPKRQESLNRYDQNYLKNCPVVFPIARNKDIERLKAAGLDSSYNNYCINREIIADYGLFWKDSVES